ncbi:MYND finger protein, putative [Plasmodium ovale wallikeri]|uniref:MYND finger protein, putative n=1 Tax=Plasmodium ovale wallikeri TaxID=864142 RepID=A0A1A8Z5R2_PLAOA|nr:MYND finger protein, putative [Plasmodium ovale wallikeri]SBT39704.1 MYND finger protein, putative [Plasmodium ovale wallikeri]
MSSFGFPQLLTSSGVFEKLSYAHTLRRNADGNYFYYPTLLAKLKIISLLHIKNFSMDINDVEFFSYVKNLKNVKVQDLFSKEWFDYHKSIVFINAYLHSNNEIIDIVEDERMNAVVTKFESLLRELITTYFVRFLTAEEKHKNSKNHFLECKMEKVENKNGEKKEKGDPCSHGRISSYISLYHEMTILNIFEIILLSDYVYEKIDSHMINLFAYIYSNLVSFLKTNSGEYFVKPMNEMSISEMLKEENDKTHNIDKLKIYINVINALRNITDRIHLLKNTVVNKIVDYGAKREKPTKNFFSDILLILIPLIEKKPWKHEDYIFEKNEYEMTNYRRNNILKLRKYMNESLHQQLPPMKTLHTFIEVPEIFDEIKSDMLKNKRQVLSLLSSVTIEKDILGSISDVYLSIYEFDQQIKNKGPSKGKCEQDKNSKQENGKEVAVDENYICNNCKENAELQCSQCKQTYYCSKECQVYILQN